ncbi:MAG: chemotaxis response regulator protein-glutamate methylesterase [Nitrospira sp.]|nr:chemotaxis response regulator protein-glutamate methylesterase [Candidatus Brocadiales bacterium]MBL7048072.1 chemotaxis response regulator protein-glutamate methylesterase [Nitrospira sp.]
MVRILIVDDSAFMRNTLSRMIADDPELEVVGIARDGIEAIEKVALLKPDIVTLDVEMPRMNGIEALKQIMATNPVPVLMVSSLTNEGAQATLEALEIGAVDFIPKNLSDLSVNIVKIRDILIEKIKTIGKMGLKIRKTPLVSRPIKMPTKPTEYTSHSKTGIVCIGSSTGGPKALQTIITALPKDFPVPIIIAQHMPPNFTGPFASRLNQISEVEVKEGEHGETLEKGVVYIAPGRGHMGVERKRITTTTIHITEGKGDYIYKPSVDELMTTAVKHYSGQVFGVILTGLGNDGEKGMREIKNKGGRTIAESEDTCVVYGMPKAVVLAGLADKVVPLDEIAGEIINAV